jgi:hypothetical protein
VLVNEPSQAKPKKLCGEQVKDDGTCGLIPGHKGLHRKGKAMNRGVSGSDAAKGTGATIVIVTPEEHESTLRPYGLAL